MRLNRVINGNSVELIKDFPDNTFDMCITSPPYWNMRDYCNPLTVWDGDPECDHDWKEIPNRNNEFKPRAGMNSEIAQYAKKAIFTDNRSFGSTCQKCGAWLGTLGLEPDHELYIKHLVYFFSLLKPKIKKDGSLYVNIADKYGGSNNGSWRAPIEQRGKEYRQTLDIDQEYLAPPAQNMKYVRSQLGIPFSFALEMIKDGWKLRNTIIWHKINSKPESVKSRFTNDFEYIFFFTKSKTYYFNQQFEYAIYESGLRNKRAVWSINTRGTKVDHFAIFPKELIETPISASCKENGIILDPFAGTGTTGIVAKKQNKRYILIDLNPKFCKIARQRLNGDNKHGSISNRYTVYKTTGQQLQLF